MCRFGTTIVPDQVEVNLRYADAKSYSGTGAIDQVFRANSLYDPDHTGTGNQPRGFDQWSALYARYMVTHCRIVVFISHNAAEPQQCTLIFTPTTSAISSPERAVELPYSKTAMLAEYPSQASLRLSHGMAIRKLRGVPMLEYSYDGAPIGSNPSASCYIHVAANTMSGASRNTVIQYTLYYKAIMFDRKLIGSS